MTISIRSRCALRALRVGSSTFAFFVCPFVPPCLAVALSLMSASLGLMRVMLLLFVYVVLGANIYVLWESGVANHRRGEMIYVRVATVSGFIYPPVECATLYYW